MAYEVPITNVNLAGQALLPSELMEKGFDLGQKQLGAQRETKAYEQQQSNQKALQDIFSNADTSTPEGQADLIRQVGRVSPQTAIDLQTKFGTQAKTRSEIGEQESLKRLHEKQAEDIGIQQLD